MEYSNGSSAKRRIRPKLQKFTYNTPPSLASPIPSSQTGSDGNTGRTISYQLNNNTSNINPANNNNNSKKLCLPSILFLHGLNWPICCNCIW
jgi:hypothetical protein